MGLDFGDITASDGMSRAIYDRIREVIEPDFGELEENDLKVIREGWQKLSYAIARGVIEYIVENMEIYGIQTSGNVSTTVSGDTGAALPANHTHTVTLSGAENDVVFTQSDDGTEHVR